MAKICTICLKKMEGKKNEDKEQTLYNMCTEESELEEVQDFTLETFLTTAKLIPQPHTRGSVGGITLTTAARWLEY